MRRSEKGPSRVLVDASNLHVGGGVQVASSLISLFMSMEHDAHQTQTRAWLTAAEYEVSPAVVSNLPASVRNRVRVVGRRPLKTMLRSVTDKLTGRARTRALHFVIFGPHWGFRRGAGMVLGYADVTAIYDAGENTASRFSMRYLRVRGSRRSVRGADAVVVESDSFGRAVEAATGKSTLTVANTYHQLIDEERERTKGDELHAWPVQRADEIRLCYVTRSYPHKNIGFLPRVAEAAAELGATLTFVVTLSDTEWMELEPRTRSVCLNIGPVRIDQVATVYRRSDAAFFPSLLEASSASPIEAMRLGVPLFASDRDFVREVCGDAAIYFPPDDPVSTAQIVLGSMARPETLLRHVEEGRRTSEAMPGPQNRADQFADIVGMTLRSVK